MLAKENVKCDGCQYVGKADGEVERHLKTMGCLVKKGCNECKKLSERRLLNGPVDIEASFD
jgi:hypothetical protein